MDNTDENENVKERKRKRNRIITCRNIISSAESKLKILEER
jgi:hypothetical protein